jgi:hypothetical protein
MMAGQFGPFFIYPARSRSAVAVNAGWTLFTQLRAGAVSDG